MKSVPENQFARNAPPGHLLAVSTVDEIKLAINRLSLEERAEVIAELCGSTDDEWDRQMKSDANSGKFTVLNNDAKAVLAAGQAKPLDHIILEP